MACEHGLSLRGSCLYCGEPRLSDREEYRGMKVTRLPSEDPEAVRARDGARLDGIGDGTDPIAYLGEPD